MLADEVSKMVEYVGDFKPDGVSLVVLLEEEYLR